MTLSPPAGAALAALAVLSAHAPAHAAEPYTIHDNFTTPQIDASRWQQLERTRNVRGGSLQMVQRDRGNQLSDTGRDAVSFATSLTGGSAVTQIAATLTVNALSATGCAQNPSASNVSARIIGTFFNTAGAAAGSRLNDMDGMVRVIRSSADAPGLLRVEGVIYRCTAADCATIDLVVTQPLGTMTAGQSTTLRIDWDAANDAFVFTRDAQPPVTQNYTVPDALPPSSPRRALETRNDLARCFSGARTEGLADVRWDNVQVNASAAP